MNCEIEIYTRYYRDRLKRQEQGKQEKQETWMPGFLDTRDNRKVEYEAKQEFWARSCVSKSLQNVCRDFSMVKDFNRFQWYNREFEQVYLFQSIFFKIYGILTEIIYFNSFSWEIQEFWARLLFQWLSSIQGSCFSCFPCSCLFNLSRYYCI